MRVWEVLALSGVSKKGHPSSDEWIRATCKECGAKHRLSQIDPAVNGSVTDYICPTCGAAIVTIRPGRDAGGNELDVRGELAIDFPPDAEL